MLGLWTRYCYTRFIIILPWIMVLMVWKQNPENSFIKNNKLLWVITKRIGLTSLFYALWSMVQTPWG